MVLGYRKNEWVAVYVDNNGDEQVVPFDTVEQATEFLNSLSGGRIGVMTTMWYVRHVKSCVVKVPDRPTAGHFADVWFNGDEEC